MASFCRIRAVLRARDCYFVGPSRRFTSSLTPKESIRLLEAPGRQNAALELCYTKVRSCTTHAPQSHVTDAQSLANESEASRNHSVEAIVSFEKENNEFGRSYGRNRTRRVNPRKPKAIRSKKLFLKMFEDRLSSGEMSEPAAYRCIKGCGNEMVMETEATRSELLEHVWNVLKTKGLVMDISHYNALLSAYVENNHTFSAVDVLSELQNHNIQPNRITFSLLLQAHCNRGEIDEALNLMNFVKEETIYASSESLHAALIDGYSRQGNFEQALKVYKDMRYDNIEPGLYAYAALLCLHTRAGDLDAVNQVFDEMADYKIQFDESALIRVLAAATVSPDVKVLEQVLKRLPNCTVWTVDVRGYLLHLFVMRDYVKASKLLKLLPVWSRREDFNASELARSCLSSSRASLEEAQGAFEAFLEQGLEFNVAENLLEFSYRLNLPEQSLALIGELKNDNQTIKAHFFYPPLINYCSEQNFDGVTSLLEQMKSCNLEAGEDKFVKQHVGKLLRRADDSKTEAFKEQIETLGIELSSLKLENDSESSQFPMDTTSVLSLLDNEDTAAPDNWKAQSQVRNLLSRLEPNDALDLLVKINEKGASSVGDNIHFYVNHMSKQENMEQAAAQFIIDLMEKGIKSINSKTHTLALSLLQKAKFKKDFFDYIAKMKEHEIYADEHQYFQMLKMSGIVGNSAAAQFCFDKIKGSPLDRANCYSHLIIAYGKDDVQRLSNNAQYSDKIIELYNESAEKGFGIFGQALSYTLLAYLSKADVEAANEIIERNSDGAPFLRSLVYNEYLRAYGKRRMGNESKALFERMRTDESLPDPSRFSYNQLFGVLKAEGNQEEIVRRIKEMQDSNITPDKYSYGELVKAHTVAQDYAGAYDALESIEDAKLRPHLGTYMNVLRKCVHNGDTQAARRGAALVKKHKPGLVTDSELSHSIVFSKIKVGNIDGADVEREAEKCEMEPKIVRRICRGASLAEDLDYLNNIKAFLKKFDYLSTDLPDVALLRVYEKRNDLDSARELHQSKVANSESISMEFAEILDKMTTAATREDSSNPTEQLPSD